MNKHKLVLSNFIYSYIHKIILFNFLNHYLTDYTKTGRTDWFRSPYVSTTRSVISTDDNDDKLLISCYAQHYINFPTFF